MGKKALLVELIFRSLCPPSFSYSKIEAICREKLSKRPNDIDVLWVLSNLYIRKKNYAEARDCLEKLLKINNTTKSTRLILSKAYYNLRTYNKVIEILENGKILSPTDSEHYYLGDCLIELKDFELGAKHLFAYVQFHKDNYIPFVKLGYSYYMLGKFEMALEAYRKAAELNPNSSEIEDSIALCTNKIKQGHVFH